MDDTSAAEAHAETVAAAEDALAHQEYVKAVTLLNRSLQQKPGDALALYDLGFAYDAQDREADAEAAWRHAIEFDPKQFESRLALGILLARRGDADAAREQLQVAITLAPVTGGAGGNSSVDAAKAPAYRALARLNASRDAATASDELREAIKLSSETDADTLLAAELAENVGDAADAEAAYRRLLAREANAPEATAGLAHLLVKEKKYPEAEQLLAAALTAHHDTANSGDTSLTAQLAGVYAAEGRVDDAVPLLEKLHAATPADANIERMLADIYNQVGEPAKADPLYQDLLTHGIPSAELLAARGVNLIKQGRYADAEAVLKRSVAIDPMSGEAWSSLAFAASENHDPQTSLSSLAQRAKFLPDLPATLFLYAVSYDALKQYKPAADYYHRFLAVAGGKFPDQEWQARHRLIALQNMMK